MSTQRYALKRALSREDAAAVHEVVSTVEELLDTALNRTVALDWDTFRVTLGAVNLGGHRVRSITVQIDADDGR